MFKKIGGSNYSKFLVTDSYSLFNIKKCMGSLEEDKKFKELGTLTKKIKNIDSRLVGVLVFVFWKFNLMEFSVAALTILL